MKVGELFDRLDRTVMFSKEEMTPKINGNSLWAEGQRQWSPPHKTVTVIIQNVTVGFSVGVLGHGQLLQPALRIVYR
jgi:hypothetical protein